jgi:hypothetical protein
MTMKPRSLVPLEVFVHDARGARFAEHVLEVFRLKH